MAGSRLNACHGRARASVGVRNPGLRCPALPTVPMPFVSSAALPELSQHQGLCLHCLGSGTLCCSRIPGLFPYPWGRSAPQLSSQPLLGELCTPAASQQGCPFPPPLSQPSVFPRQRLPTILTSARRDLSIFCDTEYPLVAGSEESQHLLPTSLHVAVCRGSGRHKVTSGEGVPRGTEMCQPRQLMQTPLLLLGERCQARMQLTAGCCREGRGWGRWGKADHRA